MRTLGISFIAAVLLALMALPALALPPASQDALLRALDDERKAEATGGGPGLLRLERGASGPIPAGSRR